MSRLQTREDDLTGRQIVLLREHLQNMNEITPFESIHVLDLPTLRSRLGHTGSASPHRLILINYDQAIIYLVCSPKYWGLRGLS